MRLKSAALRQALRSSNGKLTDMVRQILLILLIACICADADSQLPLTNKAARQCQEKDYSAALETIARAIDAEEESGDPYTWYVLGYIHKEIYKEQDAGNRGSTHRTEAIQAFEKSMSLDISGAYAEMTRSALRYLATTYLNEALIMTREISRGNEGLPESTFETFRRIMLEADPRVDFAPYTKTLYRKMAQAHYLLWEKDVRDPYHANQAAAYYEKTIALDPTDCESNYNLAIIHYNNGVHMIRGIDGSTDIMELIVIQDESIRLFRKALPFAENTFVNCPAKIDYFKAMMFINRALGNEDVYDAYKAQSEEMIRSGQLKN